MKITFSRNHNGAPLVLVDGRVIAIAKECEGWDYVQAHCMAFGGVSPPSSATVAAEPVTSDDIEELPNLMQEWADSARGEVAAAVYDRIVKVIDAHFATPVSPTAGATEAAELASCPFCGGRRLSLANSEYGLDMVTCDDCSAEGPPVAGDNAKAHAAKMWNTRAPVSPAIGTVSIDSLPPFTINRFSDTKQRGVLIIFDRRLSDGEIAHIDARLSAALTQPSATAIGQGMLRQVEELFSDYWDIAYGEGQAGCGNGEAANAVLSKLRALFAPATQPSATDAKGAAGDLIAECLAALERNYPLPITPHTSVALDAMAKREAFRCGWIERGIANCAAMSSPVSAAAVGAGGQQ